MNVKVIILAISVVMIYGCASVQGTVMPYQGGQYKSISIAKGKKAAYKVAANDAKTTCKKDGKKRYTVVSQNVTTEKDKTNTGSKLGNTAVTLTKLGLGLGNNKEVEVTTIFKCV